MMHQFRRHLFAISLAVSYFVLLAAVIAYTSVTTKPEYLGYDWIPVWLLTMPWSKWTSPLYGGLINTAVLYLVGSLIDTIRRRTASSHP